MPSSSADPGVAGLLGRDFGKALQNLPVTDYSKIMGIGQSEARFPSREMVKQRIVETEALLSSLREVDALLDKHPDLERLITSLKKLGSL